MSPEITGEEQTVSGVTAKTVKENIARAKTYAGRGDYLRCLNALSKALEQLITSKIFGREKFECEILLDEVLREVSGMDALKKVFPGGLRFKRGEERKLYNTVKKLRDKLKEVMERARIQRLRQEKMAIDELLLKAQELLEKQEPMEARKLFRKVSEKYGQSEPGIYADIGTRMMMGGLFAEAIEYFERGKEVYPKDSRPYTGLINCYEGMGEVEKAEEAVMETMRKFGANESIYVKLAKIHVTKRNWSEAYDAAKAAMDLNPLNAEAKKILTQVEPRIYGRGGAPKPGSGGAGSGGGSGAGSGGGSGAANLDLNLDI